MKTSVCSLNAACCAGMLACVGVGQLAQACSLLRDMQAAGFRPDIRAYNILLKGCAQCPEEVSRIPELLEEARLVGLEPSTATYNTLVDAYVNAGLLSRVSHQFS